MSIEPRRAALIGAAVAVIAGVLGTLVWKKEPSPPATTVRSVEVTDGIMLAERSKGDSGAPITIFEFSDFQCPYCRLFWEKTWPVLEREYIATGKARLTFVNYPIPELHPNAGAAHHFAMCAARQDRFWRAHDLLFQHQKAWEKLADPGDYFRQLGDSASLDAARLGACVAQRTEEWLVQADAREAGNLRLGGTPAFVVNGGILTGALPIEVWRPILDSIYRASQAGKTGAGRP